MKKSGENKVQSEEQLAAEFIKEYEKLCQKYGFQIIVIPAYKSRDDGTFSTVLQTSVGRLPQQNVQNKSSKAKTPKS